MVRRRSRDITRLLTAVGCALLLYFLYQAYLSPSHPTGGGWREREQRRQGQSELGDIRAAVKAMTAKKGVVPVFVVEEHHEVLGYWFLSAEHGVIPKQKNVLLHIDGHGDGGPPSLPPDFPLFTWPKSAKAIAAMMQRNDVFIMAAGLAGLLHRYIWVWPMWDEQSHDGEDQDAVWKAELGTVTSGSEGTRRLCGCWQSVDNPGQSGCLQQDPAAATYGALTSIPRSECQLRATGTVEFVSEERALELLKDGDWITSEESVIIDIDEDFYGCESAASPFYKVSIPQELVSRITDLVSFLFCAEDAVDEKSADLFFFAIIEMILKMKAPCATMDGGVTLGNECIPDSDVDTVMIQLLPDLHKTLLAEHPGRMTICEENKITQMLSLQSIVRTLVPLSVPQLQQLAETGICLRTSPRGLDFSAKDGMEVCQGNNLPNSTVVFFHSPTPHEVMLRSASLGQLFSSLKKSAGPPALVTIARSVRDGYTPRSFFHRIETDILKLLKEAFSDEVHTTLIHFDANLLGGKGGWPRRHKQNQPRSGRKKKNPKQKVEK